jgi:hypothetical protein
MDSSLCDLKSFAVLCNYRHLMPSVNVAASYCNGIGELLNYSGILSGEQ